MNTINNTKLVGLAQGLLAAAVVAALPAVAGAAQFTVLDNKGDAQFNQLLGINDSRIIVGYFGDGNIVPNNGYVLVPRDHYSVENFTHLPAGDSASQTQAIGINQDSTNPKIVGFYTDNNTGITHGFLDNGSTQLTVDDPLGEAPHVTMPVQNLLGVNQAGQAAGFWVDNNGNEHGYVANFHTSPTSFIEISPSMFPGAVATQASGVTNTQKVCGFWTDAKKISHAFYGVVGQHYTTLDVVINGVKAVSTQAFGCNSNDDIVGQFTDVNGELHGFVYDEGVYTQFDAPGSSQVAVLGVQGTLINGINDLGDVVGFFSDGRSKVNGFVDYSLVQ